MLDQDPKSWGPAAWTFLHWAAARADHTHRQEELYRFLLTLTRFLPCSKCRIHLKKNISSVKFDVQNASRTLYQLHNLVNHQNGKEDFTCFSRVKKHYNQIAKEDPPLKVWPFFYAVATFCDTNNIPSRKAARFWRQLAALLPESWAFELPEDPLEPTTRRLHRFHKSRDPAALSLQHYILKCTSGC